MDDDQQFCLKWNNHQSTLIQNFDTLLESGTLVDCTLAAEGKYLKAHRVVLSACSPYFEGLLSEHYDMHPVFILKDVKFKELKAMIDYMYRGEVNISQDQLTALLKAAESLQIKGLSESKTVGSNGNNKSLSRVSKVAPQPRSSPLNISYASAGLTIERNRVPRQASSIGDLPEDSHSPQIPKEHSSSREGSLSPTSKKRRKLRRRSAGEDTSIENHEASNSSDIPQQMGVPALAIAPVADEKTNADPTDSLGRSALMTQLTKPADEMLQMPLENPEPSDNLIEPKSEYMEDQEESVEDLTLDDDMNDLNEIEQDTNRAGPSHDTSQHPAGLATWHVTGDRSNASGVVGSVAGAPGTTDEVFLAAQEAAQAHRDSQDTPNRTTTTTMTTMMAYSSANYTLPLLLPSTSRVITYTRCLRSMTSMSTDVPERKELWGTRRFVCKDCNRKFVLKACLVRHQMFDCNNKRKRRGKGKEIKPKSPSSNNNPATISATETTNTSTTSTTATASTTSTTSSSTTTSTTTTTSTSTSTTTSTSNTPSGTTEQGKNIRYICSKCHRTYVFLTSLKRHQSCECGIEPQFICPICKNKFSQKGNLTRHLRTLH
ncbi:PREDICTED: longitudinals lacking protein, isoforms F/I/K/T-like isoform X4 [Polistes canadensis]|uniref:longitudinals lacking protein, isoforms F/I/K/T-like isoform X4 n=1 Tax=Polistes canadensis TaxID=91411 RepID=UPI000718D949|nr:PREDICTED: longitudinals lacking protein, isoforms F/I/K/T-like isoform X4 [Polistes canadensis]